MTIHVKRMWGGGPLRQFSEKQEGACNRYYESPLMKGYTGAYVCGLCERPALGVYFVRGEDKWLCSPCRELVRLPKGDIRHAKAK